MLDKITFADKLLSLTIQQDRLLSDTNINEINTIINNLVDHAAYVIDSDYLNRYNLVSYNIFVMNNDIYIDSLSRIIC